MCNFGTAVERKGIKKGMAQGMENAHLADIRQLMLALKLSAEQAMALLKIPEAEQKRYSELLRL